VCRPRYASPYCVVDTVEDTATTPAELEQAFGPEVAAIVSEVTDDKSLPKADRKRLQVEHAARLSHRAKLVKLADKVCSLRDLTHAPPDWPLERRRECFEWAKSIVGKMRGRHPPLAALFTKAHAARP
jgi:guanosine-3',5'-bis(diphosphate) 3'-pyrophosphohydrolase